MPVPAVMSGGMPTVNSGSQIAVLGIMSGWKITFLVRVASSVTTPARPTSEPVPAVVGTAMTGAIDPASARVQLSPTSSKSQIGRVWPAANAISLPASSAEPPPNATTPSCAPALNAAMPARMLDSTGLDLMSLNRVAGRPDAASKAIAFVVMGSDARTGSVTNKGLRMPAAVTASANSAIRPAPKRTEVG